MEVITREGWDKIIQEIATLMTDNMDLLTDIDARFGDGDHGTTISKIAKVMSEHSTTWLATDAPLKELFSKIGDAVTNISGGSAGPLYGTYLGGLGEELSDETESDATLLKKILAAGLTELQYLSKAKVGDKTMMDTLIPAVEAIQKAEGDIKAVMSAGAEAAVAGAENSKNFVSKFGRAKSYKEKTIGTPDAGAVSMKYFFVGLNKAL